jgi:hypothetical protein
VFLTVDINRQTQTINPELLSTLPDSTFPLARKADLALAFNPYHPDIKGPWDDVRMKHPGICLSHMSDAYTSTLIFGGGIEAKESGGDYNEAIMQLGVWSAAALEKLCSLTEPTSTQDLRPYLGFTMIGHEWKLHISWKVLDTGETVSPSPIHMIEVDFVSARCWPVSSSLLQYRQLCWNIYLAAAFA